MTDPIPVKTELRLKVNLGSGLLPKEGFINVDVCAAPGVDVVHDLETYPWPFMDDSIEEVYSEQFLEHVKEPFPFFNELYRVMRIGGKAKFIVPWGQSIRAWQDPTHVRPWFPQSFFYYNKKWRDDNKLSPVYYPLTCHFDSSVYEFSLAPSLHNRSKEFRDYAIINLWNSADNLHMNLVKLPMI